MLHYPKLAHNIIFAYNGCTAMSFQHRYVSFHTVRVCYYTIIKYLGRTRLISNGRVTFFYGRVQFLYNVNDFPLFF